MEPDKKALREEEIKIRRLRRLMDLTGALLCQANLTLTQAQKLIADAKAKALELFPDKEVSAHRRRTQMVRVRKTHVEPRDELSDLDGLIPMTIGPQAHEIE